MDAYGHNDGYIPVNEMETDLSDLGLSWESLWTGAKDVVGQGIDWTRQVIGLDPAAAQVAPVGVSPLAVQQYAAPIGPTPSGVTLDVAPAGGGLFSNPLLLAGGGLLLALAIKKMK